MGKQKGCQRQPFSLVQFRSVIADFFRFGIEAFRAFHELALVGEEVDQCGGIHAFGAAGVKAGICTKAANNRFLQALTGKFTAVFQHEMHDFVAMNGLGHSVDCL